MSRGIAPNRRPAVLPALGFALLVASFSAAGEDAALRDVAFADASRGWAVGDAGTLLRTADGGQTWRQAQLPAKARSVDLLDIECVDAHTARVCGGSLTADGRFSTGVILATVDGEHWRTVPAPMLPKLRQVTLLDARHGLAVGDPSDGYPSGVLLTQDGGRTWTPAAGRGNQVWLAAAAKSAQWSVLAGDRGRVMLLHNRKLRPARTPTLGGRRLQDVCLLPGGRGWLVGDGGLVMITHDGGLSWQAPPSGWLPAWRGCDFQTVAARGDRVWVAGDPGGAIWRSEDAGQRWHRESTGQPLPLTALRMRDDRRGWAVGALGLILSTADGGATWTRQRGGGRAAVLAVSARPRRLPWLWLARLAGDQGSRAVVKSLGQAELDTRLPRQADALQAASGAVGGVYVAQSRTMPVFREELRLTREELRSRWNRATDSMAVPLLEEDLVRAIRVWRPDVILADPGDDAAAGECQLAHQIVRAAVAKAADATAYPDHIRQLELAPWPVRRVLESTVAAKAEMSLPPGGVVIAEAATHGELAAAALAQLGVEPAEVGPAFLRNPSAATRLGSPLAGLSIDESARRETSPATELDLTTLRAKSRHRANTGRLLAELSARPDMARRLTSQWPVLLKEVSPEQRAETVRTIALRLRGRGEFDLAEQLTRELLVEHDQTPDAQKLLAETIPLLGSAEALIQIQGRRASAGDRFVEQAGFTEIGQSPGVDPRDHRHALDRRLERRGLDLAERASQAAGFNRQLARLDPRRQADAAQQMILAAALRAAGRETESAGPLKRVAEQSPQPAWAAAAEAELWLREPQGDPPRPLAICPFTQQRPRLDGRLGEDFWARSPPLELAYADVSAAPAFVKLAADQEFLYIAAVAPRCPGYDAAEFDPEEPRPYDGDLSRHDRIQWRLDLDRDYATAFEFAVDDRGWTAEAGAGNVRYNPTWYVAARRLPQGWTFEAAIPWKALADSPPTAGVVWAARFERIVPGRGMQSASPEPPTASPAGGMVLLRFGK